MGSSLTSFIFSVVHLEVWEGRRIEDEARST